MARLGFFTHFVVKTGASRFWSSPMLEWRRRGIVRLSMPLGHLLRLSTLMTSGFPRN
jgi:hypothetical protein